MTKIAFLCSIFYNSGMGKNKQTSSRFKGIQIVQICPLCNTNYNERNTHVIEGGRTTNVVHMTCSKCRSAVMALIIESGAGISSVGMVTDMNHDDVLRLRQEDPVSADDCLHLHTLLNQPQVLINALERVTYEPYIKSKTPSRKG